VAGGGDRLHVEQQLGVGQRAEAPSAPAMRTKARLDAMFSAPALPIQLWVARSWSRYPSTVSRTRSIGQARKQRIASSSYCPAPMCCPAPSRKPASSSAKRSASSSGPAPAR
jgi:hypothetical protein